MLEFEKRSDKTSSGQVFALCEPALRSYLSQIEHVASKRPAHHAMSSQNLSSVFGIAQLYSTSGLSAKNTSVTTDGRFLYLYIAHSARGSLYKIGTGENGTIAGKVYQSSPSDREGDVTWVYCQGKLFSRRTNEEFGSLAVYDAATLKKLGDARLVLGDLFGGNKTLKQQNASYPMLSDGEHLYIVTFQVEKRERKPKESLETEAQALTDTRSKGKEKAKDEKSLKSQETLSKKRSRTKSKKSLQPDAPKEQTQNAGPKPPSVSTYHVCAFTLHQFSVAHLGQAQIVEEWDSLSDTELHAMPEVQELYASFAGLFSARDCARALGYNQGDFEDAANWLIDSQS